MTIQPGVGYTFTSSSQGTNLNIQQPWAPYPLITQEEFCYPFRIYLAGIDEEDNPLFSCCPGTVNSIIPQLGTEPLANQRLDHDPTPTAALNFSELNYSYIHLKVSYIESEEGGIIFPVNDPEDIQSPRVISNSEQQFATVDSVFYLIATMYKNPDTNAITINQFANSSLWCDRIQVGSLENIPNYFFAKA